MGKTLKTRLSGLGLIVIGGALAPSAQAASGTWNGTTDGLWNSTTNWSVNPAPGATSGTGNADTATFNNNGGTGGTTITVDSGRNIRSITFDTVSVAGYTIGSAGANAGNTLVLSSGGKIQITATVPNGITQTINAPLSLAGSYILENLSAGTARMVLAGNITNTAAATLSLQGNAGGTGVNLISGNITEGTGALGVTVVSSANNVWELSGANNYSGATVINFANTGSLTFSGTNSGTGATTLSKGVMILNNASNGGLASGTLTLSQGTLQALNAARSLSNAVTLTSVTVSGAQSININGKLTGQTGGARTLTSSITGGNTLTLADVDINTDTAVVRNLTIAGTGNTTINGTIANGNGTIANGLTISNTGITTINGSNTYTGTTTVQTGATLKIGANNSINAGNALTTSGSGIFDLNGFNQTLGLLNNGSGATVTNSAVATKTLTIGDGSTGGGSFSGAMNIIFNQGASNSTLSGSFGNAGTITNSGAGTGTATISGVIGSTVTGVIQDSASSMLTLSGNNLNFAGGVTIKSGTVNASNNSALGTAAVTLGDTTGSASATLLSTSANATRTIANNINVISGSSGPKTLASAGSGGNSATNYSGIITLADNLTIGGSTGAGTLTLSGTITGSGFTITNTGVSAAAISGAVGTGVNIVHDSAGSLAISGLNNTVFSVLYRQGTGSVGVGAMDNATLAINSGAAVTFGHSALSIGGFNDGASGGGSFADNTAGTARNVTLAGSGTYSFSGSLGTVAAVNMNLVKAGTGTQTLSGSSLYTGSTAISSGTLIAGADALVSTAGAFGNASSALTLGDAATATNNSSASLLTGGAYTIARAVTVANQATTGTYTIGGNTDNTSTFSGLITANRDLTLSQVATTGSNKLNVTGGITGATAGAKTLTFTGPGKIDVATTGISNGVGTVGVNVAGGTTILSAVNSYTGTTVVSSGGTLLVNGSLAAGSAVTVASGGSLGGGGTINGNLVVNGSLTPGNSIGTLTVANDVTWNGTLGQDWKFELGAVSGSSDQLLLTGSGNDFLKGTGSDFRFNFLNTGVVGTFTLVDWTSATTFNSTDFTYTGLASGYTGTFGFSGTQLDFTVVAVPEPSTYALVAGGLVALAFLRRRKKA